MQPLKGFNVSELIARDRELYIITCNAMHYSFYPVEESAWDVTIERSHTHEILKTIVSRKEFDYFIRMFLELKDNPNYQAEVEFRPLNDLSCSHSIPKF